MSGFIGALPGAVSQGIIWGIMAIGVFITFKIVDVADLTVDGSFCTGAAVSAALITAGVNAWVALIISFFAGILAGIVTGLLHTKLGIPAILAGILTQLMLWSVNLKIMGPQKAIPSRQFYVVIKSLNTANTLLVLTGVIAILTAALYWFFGTELGCSIRATGCNLNMSRAQGINTDLNKMIGFALSNGIVAIAGSLLAQYQGSADIKMGAGAIVIGLAAVVIGEAVFSKIARNFAVKLLSVVVGGILYFIIYQFVITLGMDTDFLKLLSAVVVAVFLAVPYCKKTYFSKKPKASSAVADENGFDGGVANE